MQPDGEWRLVNSAEKLTLVNRFPKDQTGRCSFECRLFRDNILGMMLFSPGRLLQPGEQIKLEADYETP